MSLQEAIVSTMALTNHIKDIYFHIVDLRKDDLSNLDTCLEDVDKMIIRMKELDRLDPMIFNSMDTDVIYCMDDIHYITGFLKEWIKDRISLINHKNYLRLQSQLDTLQSFFL